MNDIETKFSASAFYHRSSLSFHGSQVSLFRIKISLERLRMPLSPTKVMSRRQDFHCLFAYKEQGKLRADQISTSILLPTSPNQTDIGLVSQEILFALPRSQFFLLQIAIAWEDHTCCIQLCTYLALSINLEANEGGASG